MTIPNPTTADLKVRDLAELHQLWRQARNETHLATASA